MERKKLTMEEFDSDCFKLVNHVYDSDYQPDIVVASLMGGSIPALPIAMLHRPIWYAGVDISRKGGERQVAFIGEPFVSYDIKGWNVLVVEDDNITGKGLEAVCNALQRLHGAKTRTAAIYVSPETAKTTNFYAKVVEAFPDYPYKPFNSKDREHPGDMEHLALKPYPNIVTVDTIYGKRELTFGG